MKETSINLTLSELLLADPSLQLIKGKKDHAPVIGLQGAEEMREGYFCFLKDQKYYQKVKTSLKNTDLSQKGLIFSEKLWNDIKEEWPYKAAFLCITPSVEVSLSKISHLFYEKKLKNFQGKDIHSSAIISPQAALGDQVIIEKNVQIHPFVSIMSHVHIGEGTIIFPGATLYSHVRIGKNCRIHASAVIGKDGFGYNHQNGIHHKVWHIGGVEIGNNVEIGSHSCVDAGTFSPTQVEDEVKIDNHVQVAHNCQIQKGAILCGHVAVGGSSTVGPYSLIGGGVLISDHVHLAPQTMATGGSVVISNNSEQGKKLGGYPARPHQEWLRGLAHLRKLSLPQNKKLGE